MKDVRFRAMVVREDSDGKFTRRIEDRRVEDLPEGEVLIRVHYSSLNYKDALSAIGNRGVTRKYPHTPGIDAAGVVADSTAEAWSPGDEAIVTGYDLGMNTPGGFGEYIRVPADWVVPRPQGLTLRECMIYGTAGFTAAQSAIKLLDHGLGPKSGDVLVTGGTGGVGGLAIAILAGLGFSPLTSSGKPEAREYLLSLGAKDVLSREDVADDPAKPLLKARFAAVLDTVGGATLAAALKSVAHRGAVTTCGNVGGAEFSATVYPFILRGITLYGIDSAQCPYGPRLEVWRRIATDFRIRNLDALATECTLEELSAQIDRMLAGQKQGRIILRHEV